MQHCPDDRACNHQRRDGGGGGKHHLRRPQRLALRSRARSRATDSGAGRCLAAACRAAHREDPRVLSLIPPPIRAQRSASRARGAIELCRYLPPRRGRSPPHRGCSRRGRPGPARRGRRPAMPRWRARDRSAARHSLNPEHRATPRPLGNFAARTQAAAAGEYGANRNPLQPSGEQTPLLEAPERAPGRHEGVLGAVFGGLSLTGEPQAQAVNPGRELPVDGLERGQVAAHGRRYRRLGVGIAHIRDSPKLSVPTILPVESPITTLDASGGRKV